MEAGTPPHAPGWIVLLSGQNIDLRLWERLLKHPSEPWCERMPQGGLALRSRSFDQAQNAQEVKGRAVLLIERLNGALSVEVCAEPLHFWFVGRIDADGKMGIWLFPQTGHVRLRGAGILTADVEQRDANGNPVPPPPPEPSAAQRWIAAAEKNDDLADLLVFAGRADNWFDIYKAIEMAERLSGGEHKLLGLLGASATACKNLKETANTYRHARPNRRPQVPVELAAAKPLLSHIVSTVFAQRVG
jgi:hypothetical protein